MKFLIPSTVLGKWSIGLIITFFLLFIAFNVIVFIQGPKESQTFFSNPALSIPVFLAGICAIASFFTGIIPIIKKEEHSILVYIASSIGFLVLLFVLGEILMPH